MKSNQMEVSQYAIRIPSTFIHGAETSVDFFRLITPEGAAGTAKDEFVYPSAINADRLALIKAAHEDADDGIASGLTYEVVHRIYYSLRRFLVFCDTELYHDIYSPGNLLNSLVQFNLQQRNLVEAGQIAQSTAASKVIPVGRLVAKVLDREFEALRYQVNLISQAKYNPPDSNDAHEIGGFIRDLGTIIDHIAGLLESESRETLVITFPERGLYAQQEFRFSRHGIRASWDTPFIWLREIQLRIVAEQRRFLCLTGMNPSVINRLCFDDLQYDSARKGYQAVEFKVRAGGAVTGFLPKSYLGAFSKHLEFLSKLPDNPDRLLFPFYVVPYDKKDDDQVYHFAIRKTHRYRVLLKLLAKIERPYFDARALRRNLGIYASRRNNGDALKTSRILGNRPSTAAKHYGGQGNRQENEVEMTTFFAWESRKSEMRRSTDEGMCESPNQPEGVSIDGLVFKPKCGAENSCFFCIHYRPIDSKDYIFSIVSKRARLQSKSLSKPDPQIVQTVKRINAIIKNFKALGKNNEVAVVAIESAVSRGQLHPFFENDAELEEILKQ